MHISHQLIDHLAQLSRLTFVGQEKAQIQEDMERMTSFVATLAGLDTQGVAPLECMAPHSLQLHDDVPEDGFTAAEATAQAAHSHNHYFLVPKVIG